MQKSTRRTGSRRDAQKEVLKLVVNQNVTDREFRDGKRDRELNQGDKDTPSGRVPNAKLARVLCSKDDITKIKTGRDAGNVLPILASSVPMLYSASADLALPSTSLFFTNLFNLHRKRLAEQEVAEETGKAFRTKTRILPSKEARSNPMFELGNITSRMGYYLNFQRGCLDNEDFMKEAVHGDEDAHSEVMYRAKTTLDITRDLHTATNNFLISLNNPNATIDNDTSEAELQILLKEIKHIEKNLAKDAKDAKKPKKDRGEVRDQDYEPSLMCYVNSLISSISTAVLAQNEYHDEGRIGASDGLRMIGLVLADPHITKTKLLRTNDFEFDAKIDDLAKFSCHEIGSMYSKLLNSIKESATYQTPDGKAANSAEISSFYDTVLNTLVPNSRPERDTERLVKTAASDFLKQSAFHLTGSREGEPDLGNHSGVEVFQGILKRIFTTVDKKKRNSNITNLTGIKALFRTASQDFRLVLDRKPLKRRTVTRTTRIRRNSRESDPDTVVTSSTETSSSRVQTPPARVATPPRVPTPPARAETPPRVPTPPRRQAAPSPRVPTPARRQAAPPPPPTPQRIPTPTKPMSPRSKARRKAEDAAIRQAEEMAARAEEMKQASKDAKKKAEEAAEKARTAKKEAEKQRKRAEEEERKAEERRREEEERAAQKAREDAKKQKEAERKQKEAERQQKEAEKREEEARQKGIADKETLRKLQQNVRDADGKLQAIQKEREALQNKQDRDRAEDNARQLIRDQEIQELRDKHQAETQKRQADELRRRAEVEKRADEAKQAAERERLIDTFINNNRLLSPTSSQYTQSLKSLGSALSHVTLPTLRSPNPSSYTETHRGTIPDYMSGSGRSASLKSPRPTRRKKTEPLPKMIYEIDNESSKNSRNEHLQHRGQGHSLPSLRGPNPSSYTETQRGSFGSRGGSERSRQGRNGQQQRQGQGQGQNQHRQQPIGQDGLPIGGVQYGSYTETHRGSFASGSGRSNSQNSRERGGNIPGPIGAWLKNPDITPHLPARTPHYRGRTIAPIPSPSYRLPSPIAARVRQRRLRDGLPILEDPRIRSYTETKRGTFPITPGPRVRVGTDESERLHRKYDKRPGTPYPRKRSNSLEADDFFMDERRPRKREDTDQLYNYDVFQDDYRKPSPRNSKPIIGRYDTVYNEKPHRREQINLGKDDYDEVSRGKINKNRQMNFSVEQIDNARENKGVLNEQKTMNNEVRESPVESSDFIKTFQKTPYSQTPVAPQSVAPQIKSQAPKSALKKKILIDEDPPQMQEEIIERLETILEEGVNTDSQSESGDSFVEQENTQMEVIEEPKEEREKTKKYVTFKEPAQTEEVQEVIFDENRQSSFTLDDDGTRHYENKEQEVEKEIKPEVKVREVTKKAVTKKAVTEKEVTEVEEPEEVKEIKTERVTEVERELPEQRRISKIADLERNLARNYFERNSNNLAKSLLDYSLDSDQSERDLEHQRALLKSEREENIRNRKSQQLTSKDVYLIETSNEKQRTLRKFTPARRKPALTIDLGNNIKKKQVKPFGQQHKIVEKTREVEERDSRQPSRTINLGSNIEIERPTTKRHTSHTGQKFNSSNNQSSRMQNTMLSESTQEWSEPNSAIEVSFPTQQEQTNEVSSKRTVTTLQKGIKTRNFIDTENNDRLNTNLEEQNIDLQVAALDEALLQKTHPDLLNPGIARPRDPRKSPDENLNNLDQRAPLDLGVFSQREVNIPISTSSDPEKEEYQFENNDVDSLSDFFNRENEQHLNPQGSEHEEPIENQYGTENLNNVHVRSSSPKIQNISTSKTDNNSFNRDMTSNSSRTTSTSYYQTNSPADPSGIIRKNLEERASTNQSIYEEYDDIEQDNKIVDTRTGLDVSTVRNFDISREGGRAETPEIETEYKTIQTQKAPKIDNSETVHLQNNINIKNQEIEILKSRISNQKQISEDLRNSNKDLERKSQSSTINHEEQNKSTRIRMKLEDTLRRSLVEREGLSEKYDALVWRLSEAEENAKQDNKINKINMEGAQDVLNLYNKEIATMHAENKDISIHDNALRRRLIESRNEINTKNSENHRLAERVSELEQTLVSQSKSYESGTRDANNNLVDTMEKRTELQAVCNDLKNLNAIRGNKISELSKEMELQNNSAHKRIDNLTSHTEDLKEQIKTMQESDKTNLYASQINRLTSDLSIATVKRDELVLNLEHSQEQHKTTIDRLESEKQQIHDVLEKTLEQIEKNLVVSTQEKADLYSQIDKLEAQTTGQNLEITDLNNSANKVETELRMLKNRFNNEKLEAEQEKGLLIQQVKNSKQTFDSQLSEYAKVIQGARDKIATMQKTLARTTDESQAKSSTIKSLESQVVQLDTNSRQLKTKLAEAGKVALHAEKLQSKLDTVSLKYQKESEYRTNLQVELEQSLSQQDRQKAELEQARKSITQYKTYTLELNSKLKETIKEGQALVGEKDNAIVKYNHLKNKKDEQTAQISELESTIQNLKSVNRERDHDIEGFQDQITNLENILREKKGELEHITVSQENYLDQIKTLNKEIKDTSKENDNLQYNISSLSAEINRASQNERELSNQITERESENKKLNKQIESIQVENEDLSVQLNRAFSSGKESSSAATTEALKNTQMRKALSEHAELSTLQTQDSASLRDENRQLKSQLALLQSSLNLAQQGELENKTLQNEVNNAYATKETLSQYINTIDDLEKENVNLKTNLLRERGNLHKTEALLNSFAAETFTEQAINEGERAALSDTLLDTRREKSQIIQRNEHQQKDLQDIIKNNQAIIANLEKKIIQKDIESSSQNAKLANDIQHIKALEESTELQREELRKLTGDKTSDISTRQAIVVGILNSETKIQEQRESIGQLKLDLDNVETERDALLEKLKSLHKQNVENEFPANFDQSTETNDNAQAKTEESEITTEEVAEVAEVEPEAVIESGTESKEEPTENIETESIKEESQDAKSELEEGDIQKGEAYNQVNDNLFDSMLDSMLQSKLGNTDLGQEHKKSSIVEMNDQETISKPRTVEVANQLTYSSPSTYVSKDDITTLVGSLKGTQNQENDNTVELNGNDNIKITLMFNPDIYSKEMSNISEKDILDTILQSKINTEVGGTVLSSPSVQSLKDAGIDTVRIESKPIPNETLAQIKQQSKNSEQQKGQGSAAQWSM